MRAQQLLPEAHVVLGRVKVDAVLLDGPGRLVHHVEVVDQELKRLAHLSALTRDLVGPCCRHETRLAEVGNHNVEMYEMKCTTKWKKKDPTKFLSFSGIFYCC